MLKEIKSLEKSIFRVFIYPSINKDLIPTPTQMEIIGYILSHDNTYQKDLEDFLNLRRATVSGVLKTMEKNNFILRVSCSNDARIKKITLNQKAHKIFLDSKLQFDNIENIVTKNIKKEDLEIFSQVIEKMKENVNNYKEENNDKVN